MESALRVASHLQASGSGRHLIAAFSPKHRQTGISCSHVARQHMHGYAMHTSARHHKWGTQAVYSAHGGIAPRRPAAASDHATLPAELEGLQLPKHIAVILDGNSRWARQRGLPMEAGHVQGAATLQRIVSTSGAWGVKALTVYAFSTENWQRPEPEVNFLMRLFELSLDENLKDLHSQDVQVRFIGERARLPQSLRSKMEQAEQLTSDNQGLILSIAVSYSGRADLAAAARRVASLAAQGLLDPSKVDAQCLESHLSTASVVSQAGPPDLLIRTSGEQRLSNFLLWELAYTELFFTQSHWPDFDDVHLLQCLVAYGARNRRFGARQ